MSIRHIENAPQSLAAPEDDSMIGRVTDREIAATRP